jgi:uncharacterized membrane protein (DUF4010 family)
MIVLFHALFILTIAWLVFAIYASWRLDWGGQTIDMHKNKFPLSLVARFGRRFFVLYYRVSVIIALIGIIALYVLTEF